MPKPVGWLARTGGRIALGCQEGTLGDGLARSLGRRADDGAEAVAVGRGWLCEP